MARHRRALSLAETVQHLLDSLGGWTEENDLYKHPGGSLAVKRNGNRWVMLMDGQAIASGSGSADLLEALRRY